MGRISSGKIVSALMIVLALLAILITSPASAYAEETPTGSQGGGMNQEYDPSIDAANSSKGGVASFSIDGFLYAFKDLSAEIETKFLSYATRLFWLLAIIQFTYAAISLGRRGEFSLNSIIELLIREIMYISFFWMLLSWPSIKAFGSNGSGVGSTLVEGLRKLGADVTGFSAITPSTVLDKGTDLAWLVIDGSFKLSIVRGIAAVFPALIILVAFALAAAHTAVMLIEYYVVAPVGILMLGLGGSLWTKNYAESYLRCLFTIGIKLLCLQIVLLICVKYIDKLITISGNGIAGSDMGLIQGCFFLAGLSIIFFMAVQQIPNFAAGLISGSSSGSASALTGALGAIGGAAMAAAGLAGAGKDAYDAHKDASGDSGGSGGIAEASEVSSGGSDGGSGSDGGASSSCELPSALREDSSSSSDDDSDSSSSGGGGSASPSGDGGSAASGSDGESAAPSGDGGSAASGSDGESAAPSSDGGSSASGSDGGSAAPGGDGGSAASGSDGGSAAPSDDSSLPTSGGDGGSPASISDGGSSASVSDGGSSAPDGDGGSSALSSSDTMSSSTSSPSSNSQKGSTTPKTFPSVSSPSRSSFVIKAMIRHSLGMKPMSHSMKTQLHKMQELSNMGMTDKQNQMCKAVFPGTLG